MQELQMKGSSIWGLCETHLSAQGISKFNKGLKLRKSRFSFHPGAPAPLRVSTASAIGGKQTGTGFLTTLPSRRLQPTWPADKWEEARFCMNTFYMNGTWIHGAVIYGYAFRADTNEVRRQTDELLSHAVYRVLRTLKGKRFLMGDWNQEFDNLNTFQLLRDHGWKEVQVIAQELHGREITKTCHNTSTKDFIWLSPELVPHWRRTDAASLFPEHQHLWVELHGIGQPENIHLWRKPKPILWDQQLELEEKQWELQPGSTTQQAIETIAHEFEQRVERAMHKHQDNMHVSQRGRSKTTRTVELTPCEAPVKASRHGHVTPTFHGQNKRHMQWYKQLRRLESLCRGDHSVSTVATHKENEWSKVLRAPGFHHSFATWWRLLDSRLDSAPHRLPQHLPTRQQLCAIRLTFEKEFRHMEDILIKECQHTAKKNRLENPNKIFQDIKLPPAAPISLIEHAQQAKIIEVDEEERAIVLDCPLDIDEHLPLFTASNVLSPIHGEADKVWLESIDGLEVGQIVRQEHFEGSLTKLFDLFKHEWERRWDRHLHVPIDEWDPMVEFFKTNFPAGEPLVYTKITPEIWLRSLQQKKTRAATGPDGWARQDLLKMPLDLVQALITLLERIEAGEEWPISMITGLICSLAKVENASRIQQYRPITVFSLIYRNWTSIRARECLKHLEKYAPNKSFGNLPMRTATQVWLGIQSELESAKYSGATLSGVILDIQKCFNHMPRIPIFEICSHLGINSNILRGWFGALQHMSRRFVVRGSVSPGLTSSTGCAEGCALSVVGMAALNILIDCYVKVRVPQCQLWSYVDNLELSATHVDTTLEGLHHLRQVLAGLDLLIDESKTQVWANNAHDRKRLRDRQFQVVHWTRDLGGHVQYSQVPTNKVVTGKISKFRPRWRDITRSPAPRAQKVKAIKMAAWPNALHAISSVHLRDELITELRAAAVRCLGLEQLGTSPLAQLSLLEGPMVDPGFYILHRTVMDARSYFSVHESKLILRQLALPATKLTPEVGPCSVLLRRLHQIGWHWDEEHFVDFWGMPCDIWECPVQELSQRLLDSWQFRCLHQLNQRQTFQGMDNISVTLTVRNMTKQPCDKGVLHRSLNGTFFTADHAKHMEGELPTACQFCGSPDSQYHRHWECEQLQAARAHCDSQMKERILQAGPATYNHGWIPRPKSLNRFRQQLFEVPDSTAWLDIPPLLPLELDIFTDGSCLRPRDSLSRLASWGVAVYLEDGPTEFASVSGGVVSGMIQTVTRAELCAAISALLLADRTRRPFRLWVDNAQVYKTLRRALHPSLTDIYQVRNKVKNHDLINTIGVIGYQVRHLCRHVIKVCSHQQHEHHEAWISRWSWRGNEAADHTAATAVHEHPALLRTWSTLVAEISELEQMRDVLHHTLIQVGTLAQTKQQQQQQQLRTPEAQDEPERYDRQYEEWYIPDRPPEDAKYLACPDLCTLHEWSQTLHDPNEPVRWWTWHQLFIDARFYQGDIGPWNHLNTHTWRAGAVCPPRSFAKRTRSFSTYLTKLAKLSGDPLPIAFTRRDSPVYAFWTKTLPVRVSEERCQAVDRWLLPFGTFKCHKDQNRIDKLPGVTA
eukprot:Skav227160  [mRNA]  locus=scaffold502:175705:180465:- [translate_table: standard]